MVTGVWRNWAGTAACNPVAVHSPRDEAEVSSILTTAALRGERVKAAGSGHSFTPAACTDGHMIRMGHMRRVLSVDRDASLVTVQAGISIEDLAERLADAGLALPSLGDIGYQTIAGAVATGTHGTGLAFGGIAAQIRGLSMVLADGSTLECSAERDSEIFHAARVGLGALGIVTSVTLACEDAFTLHAVDEPARLPAVLDQFDALANANEHVEFFWFPHTDRALLKRNNRVAGTAGRRSPIREWVDDVFMENTLFGLACGLGRMRPAWIPGIARVAGGLLSRREYTDRSDRVFTSPRRVRFAEIEYGLPLPALRDAVEGVAKIIEGGGYRVSFPVEVRLGAAEDAYLSLGYGRQTCYVGVHVYHRMPYEPLFKDVERLFESLDGRPHWGKIHFRDAESLSAAYPQWERFLAVRARLDPGGIFRNDYLDRVLGW